MDKKQKIEEMAKIYCKNEFLCSKGCQTNGCRVYEVSETLYNAGYRKIDDDCAVITKAELKEYKRQAVKEFAEKLKAMCSDYLYDTNFDGKNDFDIHISELSRMIDELLEEYEK